MKIGIIREGKVPIDRRVPLLPEECLRLKENYPHVEIFVQPSDIRCVSNQEYENKGIEIREDLSNCDVLIGVKEVPIDDLIPEKTYFFFSHTIKEQEYNRKLLQNILAKKINLVDYECLTDSKGARIVAFGRFAGIVGAYNGVLAYGKKYNLFDLRPAYLCKDLKDMKTEFAKVKLPNIKILVTGMGRVGKGAVEVLEGMNIKQVNAQEFLENDFEEAVFAQLDSSEYYVHNEGKEWNRKEFYNSPEHYKSTFLAYTKKTDLFISGHFWHYKADVLFTKNDTAQKDFKIKVIADVTCDIEGSIPTTLRSTTIEDPLYDYDKKTKKESKTFENLENITVMAVDNLPCELPIDASKSFGTQLNNFVFPALLGEDKDRIIERAMISKEGSLMPDYAYLENFVKGR